MICIISIRDTMDFIHVWGVTLPFEILAVLILPGSRDWSIGQICFLLQMHMAFTPMITGWIWIDPIAFCTVASTEAI